MRGCILVTHSTFRKGGRVHVIPSRKNENIVNTQPAVVCSTSDGGSRPIHGCTCKGSM